MPNRFKRRLRSMSSGKLSEDSEAVLVPPDKSVKIIPPAWQKKLIGALNFKKFTVGPYTIVDVDGLNKTRQAVYYDAYLESIRALPSVFYCEFEITILDLIIEKADPTSVEELERIKQDYEDSKSYRMSAQNMYSDGILNFAIIRTSDREFVGGVQLLRNKIVSGSVEDRTFAISTTPYLFLNGIDFKSQASLNYYGQLINKLLNTKFETTEGGISMTVFEVQNYVDNDQIYNHQLHVQLDAALVKEMAAYPNVVAVPVELGGTMFSNFRKAS